uniref:Uncharacterized protein n=1 Tax=Oryza rufipogon TaxID=4529 RepID=A0A0E0QL13_ORYRU
MAYSNSAQRRSPPMMRPMPSARRAARRSSCSCSHAISLAASGCPRCPPSHRRLQLPLRRRQPPGPARHHPPRATHACSRIAAAAAALHHGVVGRSLHVSASASAARRPQRRGPGSSASAAGRPLRLRLSLSGTTPAATSASAVGRPLCFHLSCPPPAARGALPPPPAARGAPSPSPVARSASDTGRPGSSTSVAGRPLCLRHRPPGELHLRRRSPAALPERVCERDGMVERLPDWFEDRYDRWAMFFLIFFCWLDCHVGATCARSSQNHSKQCSGVLFVRF